MNRGFLPLPEPQLSACCSNSCAAPAPEALGGRALGRNVDALHGSEEGEVPSLPTPPAWTVCRLFSHLPTSAPHILQLPQTTC